MNEKYMELALELAKKGEGKVNPNPLVGALIVKDNEIIGSGYHEKYGEAHAEVNAINNATKSLDGSTIYVTLEPCSHYGKTPPCVDLIIEKKIKKVIIGMLDPNPMVSGRSIKKLKDNDIEVIVGVEEEKCKKINESFIKYITSNLPFVILKSAISLDGKIATSIGESKWITSEESRRDGHLLRNKLSAIMVGINTIIEDNPELTCRIENGKNPIRVIVDSNLRIPLKSKVVNNSDKLTIVATTKYADKLKKQELINKGVRVIEINDKNKKVDLKELMRCLGTLKIDSILIEGGGTLNFSALEENIVDKVRFYIAPKILGGERSKSSIGGEGFFKLSDAVKLKELTYEKLSEDIVIEGYINKLN
ncbi:bifunctional diaminohydroxyphosphoribosylaminopyrimidine deaminase/5-amino-6-(5-phosphoribosylamino)uracil reductase RibD [Clostridium botulinum]|uniref:Riboflavin biosynthesis protein RibD n=1 Tax=Clostridium botulinum TaxID=1491 RepID=A0A0M1LWI8_CLOBO|nr:bifunctional diaminohydroxyphosphoribosylaminopyrimidine deaminase/5-amino-6-(5-phosphoribosylamino)uracil reductase RibD [Clostridium botulinum]AJF29256.1 riboflavin biosynthesis protein RibD [Clostridium botulinum]AJF32317.1 riboflavin biosynthesis protein RibD [Clostridium botulinum]KAI3350987.1 bifunctional diaminohydroxyphosphoribosylaminopyrimidine deaminase/5-amino-6-(5-phosphoribosylamino)uracil reductase RibD [Clostridium botulinum]KOM87777.1 riboflavin biosynthesis protein RibD [Cl